MPKMGKNPFMDGGPSPQKKRKRRPKDPDKPKRAISAYFFFMNEYREKCKVAQKQFSSVGDFTKEAAMKWRSLLDEDKKPYVAQSEKDKQRYNEEMKHYVPKTPTGRVKVVKDPNAPKKPVNGFFLFMKHYREQNAGDPSKAHKELVSEASQIWNSQLSQAERQPFEDKHAELKVQYEKDLAKYREEQAAKARGSLASNNGSHHAIPVDDDSDSDMSDD